MRNDGDQYYSGLLGERTYFHERSGFGRYVGGQE